ncbi:Ulp1 family isopeptidase [Cardinium endosymbiont of Nabis limbatus]|uniref:Ulp1 family isopeptidase n=1 Tax=Cardinium endosymbiont of Nabis limbatus TaxID=3066217 RepID=UPI003AF34774
MQPHFSFTPIFIFYTALYAASCIHVEPLSTTQPNFLLKDHTVQKTERNVPYKPLINLQNGNRIQNKEKTDHYTKSYAIFTKKYRKLQTKSPIKKPKTDTSSKPSVHAQDVILTKKMLDQLEQAYKTAPDTILSEIEGIEVRAKDLISLQMGNWLNDNIIEAYLSMIDKRSKGKVYSFNTWFYNKLLKEGYKGVSRWTKSIGNVFSYDKVLIPIHLKSPGHWCLAVIDMINKTIQYYDSQGGENKEGLNKILAYLIDEMATKKTSQLNKDGWRLECLKDIPQQGNGYDCGVFLCKFADYLAQNRKIEFTQSDMPYFRQRIGIEILNKKLM